MSKDKHDLLPIALRVFPDIEDEEDYPHLERKWKRPRGMLIFDTETRTDRTQRLTFGSYRFMVAERCVEEGLFYADDLPDEDRRVLEDYIAAHHAERLRLLTRRDFVEKVFRDAYKSRCLLVAFNFPFDISRVALNFTGARKRFKGGFSLTMCSYIDNEGCERPDKYRPSICIKHIDSKRALKGFTDRNEPDRIDRIPEGSVTGEPEEDYIFRGHFLDLRTLAFALTDQGYTLEGACEAFGVEHGKQTVKQHGIVAEEYIDYNRRDVLATAELAVKLLEEFDKHPIALQATKAYSPASIGKAYLRAMGITPILKRQPDFPKSYLGYAQSAFFGGRTSAHTRKVAVPVIYTDFLSMYSTVNILMNLQRFVTAAEIKIVDCQSDIESWLHSLKPDDLFDPSTWKHLAAFLRVIPNGDILPTRGKYNAVSNDWQVAVNYLYPANDDPNDGLWFSLPDVVVSWLLTGRIPKIVDAFRIESKGILPDLKPLKLRGLVDIDPRTQDVFKIVIEQRKTLDRRTDLSEIEKIRLDKALKVFASATSYGIYAEMNRQEAEDKVNVRCYGIDPEPFKCRVAHPEVPGTFCFPPVASLVTGSARLMLALLEYCVRESGGTYAMEDTDSMAIVATEHGGTVESSGRTINALSRKQVEDIVERFQKLNPYDPEAIPESILKIEKDNSDPQTNQSRQIYCVPISAKRYALFEKDEAGNPVLLRKGVNNKDDRWSEHGLGHLLNPIDPDSDDRDWISKIWLNIVRNALGLPTEPLGFESVPAISRVSISSPAVMRSFSKLNNGKAYAEQIKPFNFLLSCHVAQLGHPIGADQEHFHLIAPYESDSRKWLKMEWIDQYSGKTYNITTTEQPSRHTARVKTYGEIVREYEFHPESKCADAEGKPCGKPTIGLLQRRHVQIGEIKYIGKESNSIEEVESGLIHSEQNVYTLYTDPRRDEWQTKIVPALKKAALSQLAKMSGKCRRMLINARSGSTRPHKKNRKILEEIVRKLGIT